MKRRESPQPITMFDALIPITGLVFLVGLSFYLFGDGGAILPSDGPGTHSNPESAIL